MANRQGARPVNIKLVVGSAALVAALLGLWASVGNGGGGGGGDDVAAATAVTAAAAGLAVTTESVAELLTPTTLVPMNTTVPFHPMPNPEDWRVWLSANAEAFDSARAQLIAGSAPGRSGGADDRTGIWSAALLAAPIPADPIGQRVTASMRAIRELARPVPANSTKTPATVVDENEIKAYTLLQTAVAELEELGVLPPA